MYSSVSAELHCLLVSCASFIPPYAYSRSITGIQLGLGHFYIIKRIFGFVALGCLACVVFFTQISLDFSAPKEIFTVLSLFSVITTGDTKQSSLIASSISRCSDFINLSSSIFTSGMWHGIDLAFCWNR